MAAKLTRAYDLRDVTFERIEQYADGEVVRYCGSDVLARVPCAKLGEKRPSVQVADRVFAWRADGEPPALEYEGFVHRVEHASLLVLFAPSFHSNLAPGTRLHVRFGTDRLHLRRMHRAIDQVLLDVAWPHEKVPPDAEQMRQHDAFAASLAPDLPIEMNEQQLSVLTSLLRRCERPRSPP